jgi:Domain of unknown function (DUF5668)
VFCQEHVPAATYAAQSEPIGSAPPPASAPPNPYYQPPMPPPPIMGVQTSPALAFLAGLIPGVGAIYNGQYLKGLVHAIILGVLMSFANAADGTAGQAFLVMLVIAFWCYMPFEAYHTAKKRQLGMPIDEWSSLLGPAPRTSRVPLGPIILIGIGVIFLLDTLHILEFREFGRFWPVILILLGAYLLYSRLTVHPRIPPASYPVAPPPPPPPPHAAPDVMETRHEQ